jgi:hypothetical protein
MKSAVPGLNVPRCLNAQETRTQVFSGEENILLIARIQFFV